MRARQSQRGRFLTFEGIDGCGKTTQIELFARYLQEQGLPFLTTREPGGTPLGDRIRDLLLARQNTEMEPRTELLLMFAARAQHVAQVIRPALERGYLVLSDRFTDASLAYQGYGRGLNRRLIAQLHDVACGRLKPDLTLVIDIDPETSLQRARRRNAFSASNEGRFEQEAQEFHRRVRRGYRALARQERRRIRLIPGEGTVNEVHNLIVSAALPLLTDFRRSRTR